MSKVSPKTERGRKRGRGWARWDGQGEREIDRKKKKVISFRLAERVEDMSNIFDENNLIIMVACFHAI